MWIPRPLYEAIPYLYIAAGALMLAAAWFMEQLPRGWLLAGGAAGLVIGLVIWLRRRDYRTRQSEYDAQAIDE
jgi:hypothetical protein